MMLLRSLIHLREMLSQTLLLAVVVFYGTNQINAQNVGIGTTTPDEKLTVSGTIKSELNSSSSNPQILIHEQESEFARLKFTNTSSLQYFTLAGNPQRDSTQARFNIFNSDFGNIATFTGHGRFGINASNPVAAFHVNAQSDTDVMRVQRSNSTKFRLFSNDAMVFGANWLNPIPDVIRMETPNLFVGYDGNHVPEDRLEVDGGVRIDGPIKANNNYGSPGQILTTNTNGDIEWNDPCSYNRFEGFSLPGTYQWTVPSGVTEIMVELWGAGGGARFSGGGGAGGYVKAIFEVTPGNTLTFVVGAGGSGDSGGVFGASDGGSSSVSGTNISAAALGGKMTSGSSPGAGGAFAVSPPYLSATAQAGEDGYPNVTIPIYSGTFKLQHGKGGQSPKASKNYGQGEVTIIDGSNFTYNPGTSGSTPGGGAGGGNQFGQKGGDGMIIVRWN